MRRARRSLIALVVAAGFVVGVPGAAVALSADVSDFSFESFRGEYHLDIDAEGRATTRVVETIVAVFPDFDQNRGIIRAIPLRDGEVALDLTMISVTDENGDPVYWERNDYEGFAEFALGTDEFVYGRTTYVLEYTMRDTIRFFSDSGGDEFYWDINGTGWAQTFGTVSADVILSDRLADALTGSAACYLGYYGNEGECELERTDDGYRVEVSDVGGYNTLTVAIGFEGGTVVQPTLPRDTWFAQVAPKLLLGLQGLVALIALAVRVLFWRDARGRGTIIAQYEPPEHTDLLLDAQILGKTTRGIPAVLVDFAVRGIVRIVDRRPGVSVGENTTKYAVRLIDGSDAAGVTGRERSVLVALFGSDLEPGTEVVPGQLDAGKGAALYGFTASTTSYALSAGYRAKPSQGIATWLKRVAAWLVIAYIPLGIWAAFVDVFDEIGGFAFWSIAIAVIVPIILSAPNRLTAKGALVKEHLLGLREYLTVAEEERMRMLQSPEGALRVDVTDRDAVVKLNERLLGYAVLWGVEDQWVEQLRSHGDAAPDWLDGTFDSAMLRTFTTTTSSSVRPIVSSSSGGSSSWSSSGSSSFSSGSSGGGFSGGGGGGGGGGGR